jgi:hypothetical protein
MNFTIFLLTILFNFLYSYKNIKYNCNNKYSYSIYQNQINNNKNSSFYLPGFFEVFPELKLNFKKNIFRLKKCINDNDCEGQEVCCNNILKEFDKFCCKGKNIAKSPPRYAF